MFVCRSDYDACLVVVSGGELSGTKCLPGHEKNLEILLAKIVKGTTTLVGGYRNEIFGGRFMSWSSKTIDAMTHVLGHDQFTYDWIHKNPYIRLHVGRFNSRISGC